MYNIVMNEIDNQNINLIISLIFQEKIRFVSIKNIQTKLNNIQVDNSKVG